MIIKQEIIRIDKRLEEMRRGWVAAKAGRKRFIEIAAELLKEKRRRLIENIDTDELRPEISDKTAGEKIAYMIKMDKKKTLIPFLQEHKNHPLVWTQRYSYLQGLSLQCQAKIDPTEDEKEIIDLVKTAAESELKL